jgi:hypothetical protein
MENRVNRELENIQGISHQLGEMDGLSKLQKMQIAQWLKDAVLSGYGIAQQNDAANTLQHALSSIAN